MNVDIISKFAEDIHDRLNLSRNFDIISLVKGLGGKVEECSLPTGVLANISANSKDSSFTFTIQISNTTHTEARKRFSIAHEIGHLLLHMNYLDTEKWNKNICEGKIYNRSGVGKGREECEANSFAAAFLMPQKMFIESVNEHTNDDICDIQLVSEDFGVSKEAVFYRGDNLGLWIL